MGGQAISDTGFGHSITLNKKGYGLKIISFFCSYIAAVVHLNLMGNLVIGGRI
jgi:hypothetical protein